MSSTYVTAMEAHACIDAHTGERYYLLKEKVFESNVFPQTPRWSPLFFGTGAACLDAVIRFSAACEGGCLKGATGPISPSTYIRRWRAALSNPMEMVVPPIIQLKIGTSWEMIRPKHVDAVNEVLARHGAPTFQEEVLTVDIDTAAKDALPLISELYARNSETDCSGRALFGNFGANSGCWSHLAFTTPEDRRQHSNGLSLEYAGQQYGRPSYLLIHNGSAKFAGADWEVMSTVIRRHVPRMEAERPGSAEAQISSVRRLFKALPEQPTLSSRLVQILRPSNGCNWASEQYARIASKKTPDVEGVIQTNLTFLHEHGIFDAFVHLSSNWVTIGEPVVTETTTGQSQLELLMA